LEESTPLVRQRQLLIRHPSPAKQHDNRPLKTPR
jgi:hypothetical protein